MLARVLYDRRIYKYNSKILGMAVLMMALTAHYTSLVDPHQEICNKNVQVVDRYQEIMLQLTENLTKEEIY